MKCYLIDRCLILQRDYCLIFSLLDDREENNRAVSGLKDEFAQRVRTAPVHYQLQVQLHEWKEEVGYDIIHHKPTIQAENYTLI